MSFNAFVTGKRACIGRSFGEMMVRTIIAMTTWRYDIEFVEKSFYDKLPTIDISLGNHEVLAWVKKAKHI
jgi:hypothetical protein